MTSPLLTVMIDAALEAGEEIEELSSPVQYRAQIGGGDGGEAGAGV